jgi:hypothetical protein
MTERKTFDLTYVGRRFTNARMPVEVLSDLPAFRDLLVAFAKEQWRVRHPDRARVPKGFDQSLAFDLVDIQEGSAVPKLEWTRDESQVSLPGFYDEIDDIVEAAYGDVIGLISGAVPVTLNADKVRALNRFGAGLRENESIQLRERTAGGNVVSLDAHRRKALITGARETYQTRFESSGILVGTSVSPNGVDGFVRINTLEMGDIEVPLDADEVMSQYDGNLQQDVQFDVLVELDQQDNFRRVASVFDVALVSDGLSGCQKRLEEMRSLASGWHDGAGAAISAIAIKHAWEFIIKRHVLGPAFRLFPDSGGGVLIDFEHAGWDYSLLFKSSGSVEMYGVEIDGQGDLPAFESPKMNEDFLVTFDAQVLKDGN